MDSYTETSSDDSKANVKINKPFICTYEGCSAKFAKNSKLLYHIRRHTGERPFVCDEPNCNKTYLNSFHLRRHKKVYHENHKTERISCTVEGCYQEMANVYSLRKHCLRKHNPNREYAFMCDMCNQGFSHKRQLLQHSFIHSGIPPFKCDTCGTRFPTIRDCNRHKRTHTTYKCECKAVFERWTQLVAHRKTCEVCRPQCKICNKYFKNKGIAKEHAQIHVEQDSKDVYPCPYDNCSRYYFYEKNLRFHIDVNHTNLKKHKQKQNRNANLESRKETKQTLQNTDTKKSRRPRKDKGLPKKCMAAVLAGIELPPALHRVILEGGKVNLFDEEDSSDTSEHQNIIYDEDIMPTNERNKNETNDNGELHTSAVEKSKNLFNSELTSDNFGMKFYVLECKDDKIEKSGVCTTESVTKNVC